MTVTSGQRLDSCSCLYLSTAIRVNVRSVAIFITSAKSRYVPAVFCAHMLIVIHQPPRI